jgi:hypothetical protein
MPQTDAVAYLHGSGTSAFGPLTNNAGVYGDPIGAAGSQYSNLELDFGAPASGATNPWLTQFPSLTEKTYTAPPEVIGAGGVQFGIHIVVGQAFNTLTSINFQVCTSATTGALVGSSPNPIAARTLTLAQLQVVGAHYFIPVQGSAVLEFLRFYAAVTGSNPTLGTITSWFGPLTGGEQ